MSAFSQIVIMYLLAIILSNGFNIDCNDNTLQQCQNTIINCPSNQNCTIQCISTQSCIGSTINCPSGTGDCSITCQGGQSCQDVTINATQQLHGKLNLECIEGTDHCKNIKVFGSNHEQNTDDFNIICSGHNRACVHSEIYCSKSGKCHIQCQSESSCRWIDIIGSEHNDVIIDCNGTKSCHDGIINAQSSTKLYINGCTDYESCLDLTVYCPPYNKNTFTKNCFIQGNDALGRDNAGGTRIYAVNGWMDIDIDYSGGYGSNHGGKIFCGEGYNYSCNIADDSWQCENEDDFCNNIGVVNTTNNLEIATTTEPKEETSMYTSTTTQSGNETMDDIMDEGESDKGKIFGIFTDEWPFMNTRLWFAVGILMIIIIFGCYCYCHRKCKQRRRRKKMKGIDGIGQLQHMQSWPKVHGIDDDFYPSTTKEEEEVQDGIIIDSGEPETSVTNTFPETMVRSPKGTELASSHTANMPEHLMVAMIEETMNMNNRRKGSLDPRSPNAKLSASPGDRFDCDDVLALDPVKTGRNNNNYDHIKSNESGNEYHQRRGDKKLLTIKELLDDDLAADPSLDDIVTVSSSQTSEKILNQWRQNNDNKGTGRFHVAAVNNLDADTTRKTFSKSPTKSANDKKGSYVEMIENTSNNNQYLHDDDEMEEDAVSDEEDEDEVEQSETDVSSETISKSADRYRFNDDKNVDGEDIHIAPPRKSTKSKNKKVKKSLSIIQSRSPAGIDKMEKNDNDINNNVIDKDDNDHLDIFSPKVLSPEDEFNKELMNPELYNKVPTTHPSIFSPTANY